MTLLDLATGHRRAARARLGRWLGVTDVRETMSGWEHTHGYATKEIEVPRPRTGAQQHEVRCPRCGSVTVIVWSYSRALRNKFLLAVPLAPYLTYAIFYQHRFWELEGAVSGFWWSLWKVANLAMIMPGLGFAIVGLMLVMDPSVGSASGVGGGSVFPRDTEDGHKLFDPI